MPNNKDKKALTISSLRRMSKQVNDTMDDLYNSTYLTSKENDDDLNTIANNIQDNISAIISRNKDEDISGISRIYSRLKIRNASNDKEFKDAMDNLFSDNTILDGVLSLYMSNKWIRDLDNEYDAICKYVPKLEEALAAKKDAILSSDNFAKDFLNASSSSIEQSEQALFSQKYEVIKNKYKLIEFVDKSVDNMQKYGEDIVYCVPYSKAIKMLLDRKSSSSIGNANFYHLEETIIENGSLVNEASNTEYGIKESLNNLIKDSDAFKNFNLTVSFDNGYLKSAIDDLDKAIETKSKQVKGLYEQTSMYFKEDTTIKNISKLNHTIDDDLEYEYDTVSQDGLINNKNKSSSNDVNVPGCLVKRLKHENVIPIYIDQLCLGYYYIEFADNREYFGSEGQMDTYATVGTGINPLNRSLISDNNYTEASDLMLRRISSYLSQRIDKQFVNSNQDLTEPIYMILKHNDLFNVNFAKHSGSIKISFLPEEDVLHMAFNWDEDLHRGISDLTKGLIPAKLYACLYITNTIGILTRGQDKRVYYVKQQVETNIAQTMLNVINQIKKSNFGIRQIENMNSILNITGKFNDFVIPTNQSGESPVQFEVMPGQQIDPKTELMQMLEDQAVNSTDIPVELIQARQSLDYAIQLTMSNSKFLRHIFKRQAICEYYFSKLITKIYNYEYDEDIIINITLPTPLFLNMTNINQLIQNIREYAESIANFEYPDQDDQDNELKKSVFINKIMRQKLSTYIKLNEIDILKDQTDIEVSKIKTKHQEDV